MAKKLTKEEKCLQKLREQNEFLKGMLRSLDDVKHGRVKKYEYQFIKENN